MENVTNKADAMVFAINKSTTALGAVNCEQADKIYRMFVDNINLPEYDNARIDTCLSKLGSVLDNMKSRLESSKDSASEKIEADK